MDDVLFSRFCIAVLLVYLLFFAAVRTSGGCLIWVEGGWFRRLGAWRVRGKACKVVRGFDG